MNTVTQKHAHICARKLTHALTYTQHTQTAEYLLDHGLLDLVVPRSFLKGALFEMIGFYKVRVCCVWSSMCVFQLVRCYSGMKGSV